MEVCLERTNLPTNQDWKHRLTRRSSGLRRRLDFFSSVHDFKSEKSGKISEEFSAVVPCPLPRRDRCACRRCQFASRKPKSRGLEHRRCLRSAAAATAAASVRQGKVFPAWKNSEMSPDLTVRTLGETDKTRELRSVVDSVDL